MISLLEKPRYEWTDDMMADLRRMRREGKTFVKIARHLNATYGKKLSPKSVNYRFFTYCQDQWLEEEKEKQRRAVAPVEVSFEDDDNPIPARRKACDAHLADLMKFYPERDYRGYWAEGSR
jgi:hypothetical protein